ncbi:MAG: universal stress protein [Promethearchaeota archaeon]|jgi:nucleotide-binding universal stress UspA family protein
MYKKILIGVDNSEDASRVIEKAVEIQKRDNSEVVVFHSIMHHLTEYLSDMGTSSGIVGLPFNYNSDGSITMQIRKETVDNGKILLKQVDDKFKEANSSVETRLVFDIAPERYIKKKVEEEEFDLVILGCKGDHSKLKRTILGTIPEYVINNVKSDVLIIK